MSASRPFLIDGVAMPTPTEYKFGIEDLSSEKSGRTLDGVMHKDVVAVKDYYECIWKHLSWNDAATILNAVDGKRKVRLTYVDPRKPNRWPTNDFYVGKRSGSAKNIRNLKNTWGDITLQFTRI